MLIEESATLNIAVEDYGDASSPEAQRELREITLASWQAKINLLDYIAHFGHHLRLISAAEMTQNEMMMVDVTDLNDHAFLRALRGEK